MAVLYFLLLLLQGMKVFDLDGDFNICQMMTTKTNGLKCIFFITSFSVNCNQGTFIMRLACTK